jgi:hypothetical protein
LPDDARLSPLTATTAVNIQPTTQDAGDLSPHTSTPIAKEELAASGRSRATSSFSDDEAQEMLVRKRARQNSGFSFNLPFRF